MVLLRARLGANFFSIPLNSFWLIYSTREKEKALGFGLSKDNIGDATIDVGSEKGFVLALSEGDSIVNSDEPKINSTTTFNGSTLSIEADPATGEFVAYLPPEKYFVADVRSSQYTFDETYNIYNQI